MMTGYQEEILMNEDYLTSLLAAINQATSSIDMEVYIYEEDEVGQQVADALCQAAKRGVQVRLLVDGIGSINWGGRLTQQMEEAGIKTKVFHPLPWKMSHWKRSTLVSKYIISKLVYLLSKINVRNHRKICMIDKETVFVGSANISHHLIHKKEKNSGWRETSVKLIGVNTDEIQFAFDKTWKIFPFQSYIRRKKFPADSIFKMNHSWRRRHWYYKTLLDRISYCKERIWVTNAYFVPDSHLLKELIKASKRGVDVRILLPEKSDLPLMSMVTSTFYARLIKNGVLIYEYLPAILHAKVLILDHYFLIGSSNLNYRSFKHDLEINVDIKTDEAKKVIEQQFLSDLKQSRQLALADVNNQSLIKKMLANIILLIRYWI